MATIASLPRMLYNDDNFVLLLAKHTTDFNEYSQFAAYIRPPSATAATAAVAGTRSTREVVLEVLEKYKRIPVVDRPLRKPEETPRYGQPFKNPLCLPIPPGYTYDAESFFDDKFNGEGVLRANFTDRSMIPVEYIAFALAKAMLYYQKPCVFLPTALPLLVKGVPAAFGSRTPDLQEILDVFMNVPTIAEAVKMLDRTQLSDIRDFQLGRTKFLNEAAQIFNPPTFLGIVLHLDNSHFAFAFYHEDNLYVFNSLPSIGDQPTLRAVRMIVANFVFNVLGFDMNAKIMRLAAMNNRPVENVPCPLQKGNSANCGFYTVLFMFNFMRSINAGKETVAQVKRDVVSRIGDETVRDDHDDYIYPQDLRVMIRRNIALYKSQ
jgi:hypothetical protein